MAARRLLSSLSAVFLRFLAVSRHFCSVFGLFPRAFAATASTGQRSTPTRTTGIFTPDYPSFLRYVTVKLSF